MAKPKGKKKQDRKELIPIRIQVSEIHRGDLIVVKMGGRRQQDIQREIQEFFAGERDSWPDEGSVVVKSQLVKSIDICPGQWRTHIHINETDCYDIRSFLRIAVEKEPAVPKEEEASGKYVDA